MGKDKMAVPQLESREMKSTRITDNFYEIYGILNSHNNSYSNSAKFVEGIVDRLSEIVGVGRKKDKESFDIKAQESQMRIGNNLIPELSQYGLGLAQSKPEDQTLLTVVEDPEKFCVFLDMLDSSDQAKEVVGFLCSNMVNVLKLESSGKVLNPTKKYNQSYWDTLAVLGTLSEKAKKLGYKKSTQDNVSRFFDVCEYATRQCLPEYFLMEKYMPGYPFFGMEKWKGDANPEYFSNMWEQALGKFNTIELSPRTKQLRNLLTRRFQDLLSDSYTHFSIAPYGTWNDSDVRDETFRKLTDMVKAVTETKN